MSSLLRTIRTSKYYKWEIWVINLLLHQDFF